MRTKKEMLADALQEEYETLPDFDALGGFNSLHEYPATIEYLRKGTLPANAEDNELLQLVKSDFESIYSTYFLFN